MTLHRRGDSAGAPPFDPTKCYVHLTQVRADGFVEFQFAIGDPELAVDLILPADAYREFCRDNHAVLIASPPAICSPLPSPPTGDAHVG